MALLLCFYSSAVGDDTVMKYIKGFHPAVSISQPLGNWVLKANFVLGRGISALRLELFQLSACFSRSSLGHLVFMLWRADVSGSFLLEDAKQIDIRIEFW